MSGIAKADQVSQRPEGYPERVPEFATEEAEREFWDTHDATYYLEGAEDVTHNPPPNLRRGPGREGSRALKRPAGKRMVLLSLHMHEDTIAALKEIAARRHIPYQTLM